MDIVDKKKEQIKALIEKMKQEGKPIDWATAVLCWMSVRPAVNGRTVPRGKAHWLGNRRFMLMVSPSCCKRQDGSLFYPHFIILQKVYFIGGAQLHWPSTPTSGEANTEQLASAAKDDRIAHMLSIWSKSIRLVVCLYNFISYFIWTSYSSYAGWIF